MCDVTALAVLAIASTAMQATAQAQQASYNVQSAKNRAEQARQNAMEQERRQRKDVRRKMSSAEATMSAAGIVSTTGTPLLVADEMARNFELDVLTKRFEAEQSIEAAKAQARLARFEGNQAIAGTILTGASKTGSLLAA